MSKNKQLYLIYINEAGKTWRGENIYEFLFSDTTDDVDGYGWDVYPAAGTPEPPKVEMVLGVGKLHTEIKFDLIQNSDTFSVWDAVDGVIALGWENIVDYDEYPEKRMCFKFGEEINSVVDKLSEKEIILKINKIDHE